MGEATLRGNAHRRLRHLRATAEKELERKAERDLLGKAEVRKVPGRKEERQLAREVEKDGGAKEDISVPKVVEKVKDMEKEEESQELAASA